MHEQFLAARPVRVDPAVGPWVALVGAGPGDPELLTRRAATLLAAADVVLHDWLSGAAVLELVRPGALLVDVGKGKGCGTEQRDIERLIVAHHHRGARVVRLKGGDPFIFGRGMEEVRAAEDAGIAVEVVPGVSSALAAPALGGIAVTERHVSAQVTVVAGHRVDGTNDWTHLACLDGTLVVLMAATTAGRIAATLIERGAPRDRPVAVVADASGAGQAVWRTTLAGLAVRDGALPGPCVVVVGEVARARPAVGDQVTRLVELLRRDPVGAGVS